MNGHLLTTLCFSYPTLAQLPSRTGKGKTIGEARAQFSMCDGPPELPAPPQRKPCILCRSRLVPASLHHDCRAARIVVGYMSHLFGASAP
jgi:hypothetical protein